MLDGDGAAVNGSGLVSWANSLGGVGVSVNPPLTGFQQTPRLARHPTGMFPMSGYTWREVGSLRQLLAHMVGKTVVRAESLGPDADLIPDRYADEREMVYLSDGGVVLCTVHDAEGGYSEYTPGCDMSVNYYIGDPS